MSDPAQHARRAAASWGLPEPVLVRTGMNALFTAGDGVVLRVGPAAYPAAAERAWAALMSSRGVRVPQWVHDMSVEEGEGEAAVAVVAIERIHPAGEVDWREVGAMIRRVHAIDPAEVPGLGWCGDFPHWQLESLLAEVDDLLDAQARAGLRAALGRGAGWQERARPVAVVCHGDVHPGNVLPTADGPVLLDWDLRCLGPAAWDHGPLMTWHDRWGGPPGLYEAFAEGYGQNLRCDPLGECLAELRNAAATLLRLRAGRHDPAAAAQAELRLRFWRGEPNAPAWTAQ